MFYARLGSYNCSFSTNWISRGDKVGDTITAVTTPENATNVASYQWYSGTTADKVDNVMTGETNASLKVDATMVGQYFKVIATDTEGQTFESAVTTEPVTTVELGIKSVETADSRGYYLNVTFTKKLDSLNVTDVDIRDTSTKELFTVESVNLSSDGLTASIAMKGAATQGQASSALEEGVSYTLTITQNGKSASSQFEVQKVRANAIVEDYDKNNKQITLTDAWSARNGYTVAVGTVTLSDDVASAVNYEDLLGRTVTVWMDSSNKVTKLEELGTQTVEYDYVTAKENASGKDIVTGSDGKTTYGLETTTTTNHSTQDAVVIDLANKFAADAASYITTTEAKWTYAKIVKNSDGYAQAIVFSDATTTVYKVDEMSGNTLTCGGSNISLKDYTIVKDGKGITSADIAVDDIVVVYAADKFAEVYSNSVTGVPTAAYSDRFTLEGTSYKFATTVYATSTDGQAAVTASKMKDIVDSKAEITVYFDRKGDARFLTVNSEEKSSTIDLIVNKGATGYAVGDKHYINFKAWDGTTSSDISIVAGDLTKVKFEDGTEFKPTTATPLQFNKDTTTNADWESTSADTYVFGDSDDPTATGAKQAEISAIAKGDLISITKDENGKITGLNLTAGKAPKTGDTSFSLGSAAVDNIATTTDVYDNSKTTVTIAGVSYTIASTTPVYKLADDGTTAVTASKTTYAEASGKVKAEATATVTYYVDATKGTVTSIVVAPGKLTASTTTVRGVITDSVLSSDGTKLVSIKAITADGEKEYKATSAFESTTTSWTAGLVYDLSVDESGNVAARTAVTAKVDDGVVSTVDGAGKITLTSSAVYSKSASATPIYVEHKSTGFEVIEATDIEAGDYVDIYVVGASDATTATSYDVVIKDSVAKNAAALKTVAITKIGLANDAFTALDGTTAKWTAYTTADSEADTAISAWASATGLTASASNLDSTWTTFDANATAATTTLDALKTEISAKTSYSSDTVANQKIAFCGLYESGREALIQTALLNEGAAGTHTLTVTYKDGTTFVCSNVVTSDAVSSSNAELKGTGTK